MGGEGRGGKKRVRIWKVEQSHSGVATSSEGFRGGKLISVPGNRPRREGEREKMDLQNTE